MVRTVERWYRSAVELLPKGQSLPEDVWRSRHRALCWLLRVHVAGILVLSILRGYDLRHGLAETGVVAVLAILAGTSRAGRRFSSAMAALGLVVSSAMVVHLSGGVIEAHFHFFVMVGILTLYQDWQPFLLAISFVAFHHGVIGTVASEAVYNHADAVAHPIRWALVHAAFVLAASVASVVAWRLNEEQAFKDSLTGLPNRRLFRDRVGHALARTGRRPGPAAVLFIDLDRFKDVNDSLGHSAGDQLLISVAERLQDMVRPGDTVARLGGDEFAVLAEDIVGESDALRLADRVLHALGMPFSLRGKEVVVGASVGLALTTPKDTVDELLRNADVAMYSAKTAGRGCCRLFEDDMHAAVVRRVELEDSLRRALDAGEFELCYQPIFALPTGRLSGFEALLRWNHPGRGRLTPGDFLDLAEETGAIVDIGAWALHEACRQSRRWNDTHPGQPLTMAVNLSASQLFHPDIVAVVAGATSAAGVDPANLVLELTESVLADAPAVAAHLRELRGLGVQIAIDDFGTGYSSLSYLRRLPIDVLKVDKMFVDDVACDAAESAVTRAIIKLAQTLELTIVAEGVEAEDQAVRLRELGCDFAQGYWFAKPLNVDAVNAILRVADIGDQWLTVDHLRRVDEYPPAGARHAGSAAAG